MTMHRLMGSFDILPMAAEAHLPAKGASVGGPVWLLINPGGILGFWKMNWSIHMGPIHTRPMAQGHDAGPLRLHFLIVKEDPTPPAASVAASGLATALSGIKLPFTAHTVQISVGGQSLPVCCQPIPWTPGFMAAQVCGVPSMPNWAWPIIPTHLSVYAGLTWGDILGGVVNIVVDALLSVALGKVGDMIGDVSKVAGKVFNVFLRMADASGLGVGPSNPGGLVQQWIDGDSVGSDTSFVFKISMFFGIRVDLSDGEPSWDDLEMVHPGNCASLPWSL